MEQQRIALYGGTFDPVHAGHLAVAQKLLQLFSLDTVLFIPAHVAPHKRTAPPSSAWQRYAMLALATQDEPRCCVSSIELESPERPYTVETLARLQSELGPSARLFFVMGADSWAEIDTWRDWERVLTLCDHIVVTRPGYALDTAHVTDAVRRRLVDLRGLKDEEMREAVEGNTAGIFFTDAVQMNVSATEIRRALGGEERDSTTAAALLPPPVAKFIEKYQLYGKLHGTEANDPGRHRPERERGGG